MRNLVRYWRVRRAARRGAIAGGAFDLPPVGRTIVFVAAILILGLGAALVAFADAIVRLIQVGVDKIDQSTPPSTAGAMIGWTVVNYLNAWTRRH
jgi:hypothetical protein